MTRRAALLAAGAALLLLAPLGCAAAECHKDCTKKGNCNAETGECQCRVGFSGRACEVDVLSACRVEEDSEQLCGYDHTLNCHCARQCYEHQCRNTTDWDGQVKVLCERGHDPPWQHRGCYLKEGVPLEQQRLVPPEKGEKGFKFYEGYLPDAAEITNQTLAMLRPGTLYETLAPTACPQKCGPNSQCVVDHGEERGPYCRCHRMWEGETCETPREDAGLACPLACSGRGKCRDWFCHCEPPYWGLGCERGPDSVVPEDKRRGMPLVAEFKIYMYEIPSNIAYPHMFELGDLFWGRDWLYGSHYNFLEQLLTSPVRTYDPTEAHLFYVPMLLGSYSGASPDCLSHIQKTLEYVQQTWPYWNRTNGKDHFVFTPSDRGSCHLPKGSLGEKAIKLTHFAYHHAPSNSTLETVRTRSTTEYGCYLPQRDVPVVPYEWRPSYWANISRHLTMDQILEAKKGGHLLYFGGDIPMHPDAYWDMSGGARQVLYQLWNESWGQDKELLMYRSYTEQQKPYHDYQATFRTSKYCYTPHGWGWGVRLPQAMAANCIPVIIQSHTFQYFEDLLPYESFSVRLSLADIPRIREILKSITDEQYRGLMENLVRYRDAFHWELDCGGRAFEFTIASLRRRYMNYKALYY